MANWSSDPQIGWLLSTNILVLDCTKSGGVGLSARDFSGIIGFLRFVRDRCPQLKILLVDGGLSQKRIVAAFQEGIAEYFASPYDTNMISDKITSIIENNRKILYLNIKKSV